MAAIFGFNGCGRLGSGKKFVPREWSTAKNKERGGGRGVKVTPARSIVILEISVRSRKEFLIGAFKLNH